MSVRRAAGCRLRLLASLVPVALAATPTAAPAQDDDIEVEARRVADELTMLRAKSHEVATRLAELMRLRIAWDLLVPIDESALLEGTTAGPPSEAGDVEAQLTTESARTGKLRARLAELQRLERVALADGARLPEQVPAAPGDIAPPVRRKALDVSSTPAPDVPPSGDAILRLAPSELPGIPAPRPIVVDPFAAIGHDGKRLAPAASELKRVAALLRAGFAKQALVDASTALEARPNDAGLLFLRAQALEADGRFDAASEAYEQVRAADRGAGSGASAQSLGGPGGARPSEGSEAVPGPWAKAAELALLFLEWRKSALANPLPDPGRLTW